MVDKTKNLDRHSARDLLLKNEVDRALSYDNFLSVSSGDIMI